MNRIEFIGQTHPGCMQSLDDIANYFDHIMTAYDVVESANNLSVDRVPDNYYNSLKIVLKSPNQSELDSIVSYVNDTLHNEKITYERSFLVTATRDEGCVELSVREK